MGRDKRNEKRGEHFAALTRMMMESDAWRALSPSAQALYPWVKLEWHGPKANNNGKLQLSVRQAAERMGCTINTAARAFHALQAKGFLVVTTAGCLGLDGHGRSTSFELTEVPLAGGVGNSGRRLYLAWRPGHDFPVIKAATSSARGRTANPKSRLKKGDGPVARIVTLRAEASPK